MLEKSYTGFVDGMHTCFERGGRFAAVELTSEALANGFARAWQCNVGVFTNLTHDHLDAHGSPEHYLASKAQLFVSLPAGATAVLNAGDPVFDLLSEIMPPGVKVLSYAVPSRGAVQGAPDLVASSVDVSWSGTTNHVRRARSCVRPSGRGARARDWRRVRGECARGAPRRGGGGSAGRGGVRGPRGGASAARSLRGGPREAVCRRRLRAQSRRARANRANCTQVGRRRGGKADGRVRRRRKARQGQARPDGRGGTCGGPRDPHDGQSARRGPGGHRARNRGGPAGAREGW